MCPVVYLPCSLSAAYVCWLCRSLLHTFHVLFSYRVIRMPAQRRRSSVSYMRWIQKQAGGTDFIRQNYNGRWGVAFMQTGPSISPNQFVINCTHNLRNHWTSLPALSSLAIPSWALKDAAGNRPTPAQFQANPEVGVGEW